ncbi:MAG: hypothetical protein LBG78_09565 [Azoarcus sp.]|jgi:hypothetical protein|nr:hypothetical protein [Azoarcus sp.]
MQRPYRHLTASPLTHKGRGQNNNSAQPKQSAYGEEIADIFGFGFDIGF